MSRRTPYYLILLVLLTACGIPSARSEQSLQFHADSIPAGAQRLMEAYHEQVIGYEDNHIIFWDYTRLIYNEGKNRTTEQMHIEQDVKDIFYQDYDTTRFPPDYGYDPGRYRSAKFMDKLYGSNLNEVLMNLVKVEWCPSLGGTPVYFTKVAGAAEALKRVSDELEQHPELREWVIGAQTFCYRNIARMKRRSPHSYGIAIDLAVPRSHYWRSMYPYANEYTELTYTNTFDMRVVEIFEKHGFIWGGRWYHFDTMHFEYRPEMNPPKSDLEIVETANKPRWYPSPWLVLFTNHYMWSDASYK